MASNVFTCLQARISASGQRRPDGISIRGRGRVWILVLVGRTGFELPFVHPNYLIIRDQDSLLAELWDNLYPAIY